MKMSDCLHDKVVCPKHDGSFDCTPFCDICEGNQDYCTSCDEWEAEQAEIYIAQHRSDDV